MDDQSLKDQKQKSIIHLSTISLTFTSKHSKESKGETVFPENNSTDFPSPKTLLCVHNITHSLPPSLRHTKKERLSECQRTTDVRRIRRGATQLRSTPVLLLLLCSETRIVYPTGFNRRSVKLHLENCGASKHPRHKNRDRPGRIWETGPLSRKRGWDNAVLSPLLFFFFFRGLLLLFTFFSFLLSSESENND